MKTKGENFDNVLRIIFFSSFFLRKSTKRTSLNFLNMWQCIRLKRENLSPDKCIYYDNTPSHKHFR